jgi:integrase
MAKRGNEPTKAELKALADELLPGQRVRVGDGIYMTVDQNGVQRFQWRARMGGRGSRHASGTHGSFGEAKQARDDFTDRKSNGVARRLEKGRKMAIEVYVARHWFLEVCDETEPATQLDYKSVWKRDIEPFWKGVNFEDMLERDDFKDYELWLKRRKKHKHGPRKGQPSLTAIERAQDIFFRILQHAVDEGFLPYNPFERANRKRRKTKRKKKAADARNLRAIRRDEVPSVLEIERVRLNMPGRTPLELTERRLLISLIGWMGLRCGEATGLRWSDCRDRRGPLSYLTVRRALKDVAGYLMLGPTKNKVNRSPVLWKPIVEELDALYQAQGCPPLDQHIFRNRTGGFYRWDNFRDRSFYRALEGAGTIDTATPSAEGAFDPKDFRHTAATLHFHARKPNGEPYAAPEIAERMGHTVGVLHSTYTGLFREDMHGVAGRSFDEIIRATRREVWGALPGDPDFEDVELTTTEAALLTGLSIKAIGARIYADRLPARYERGRYLISRHALLLHGLLKPEAR